ncbi:MAG: gamma-glutamyl-gamma-aminobutyrate hydrolase family protein [Nocardioidaceae bacterium]|nr:gamma-glutamyl-gamma-aminobutyrate hydrolase family protein [Nocardioidaceae bacterium]
MGRPVIGITSYVEPASWAAWRDTPAALVPHTYVRQVHAAGGLALVVPPLPDDADESDAREVLARLDGLILAGGVDVEPARYDREPHPTLQPSRPDRDASELLFARVTRVDDVAVLGVCRGMQVMAVAAGGTLEQHLPDRLGHTAHSPGPGRYGEHPVELAPGSRLHAILGGQVSVPTYHHQGVESAPGYVSVGWSTDGVLEAVEDPAARFRVAVQWHPEVGSDPRLFHALVAACRR